MCGLSLKILADGTNSKMGLELANANWEHRRKQIGRSRFYS